MAALTNIQVRITAGGERADAHIPAGFTPGLLTLELLGTLARDAGVEVTAAVQSCMASVCADFRSSPRELVAEIARAVPAVNGSEGGWIWEPRFDPNAEQSGGLATGGEGATDHYHTRLHMVAAGQVVARITGAKPGVDGRSVVGKVIPAKVVRLSGVRAGAGLTARSDGAIVAALDGVLRIDNQVACVAAALVIDGCVDFNTGHVDFKGDVKVSGAVRDGFKVHATGTIVLAGPVEGADIRSGGNLVCPRGIASARRSAVNVQGNAEVSYMRNTDAVFAGALVCRGEIEHCDVAVGGALDATGGRVIGGRLALTGRSEIGVLGSPDWTPTILSVGELPIFATRLKSAAEDACRLKKAITAKNEEMAQLRSFSSSRNANARERVTELQFEASELMREHLTAETELVRLQEMMAVARTADLRIVKAIYPRVTIEHAGKAHEITTELKGPVRVLLDEQGNLILRDGAQGTIPLLSVARTGPVRQAA